MNIAAGEFKAKCLKLMDDVNIYHEEIIITKYGKPIAKLVPVEEEEKSVFGFLQDSVQIKGDIIQSIGESWDAEK